MAAFVYLEDPNNANHPSEAVPGVMLDSSAEYWYLYRYFEAANLDRSVELVDLYGGAVIEGYQLHRLQTELENALDDAQRKTASWRVLVGWSSVPQSQETEDWQIVEKSDVIKTINSLLELVRYSSTSGLKLVSSGD
ncbi:MAG TPA: hypothetical protein VNW52_08310 [Burkholderiaceae bacterium]|jgi:hypothetical protein|nr:hypothetical protein [Burkholderiaceae bacterium]